ncbi:Alpha/Beta hydrolase protein [Cokeromyces recurvatus]|uniref:Alpha/Beta hydrolase protein n=1 Tax=Cokeromyces recurvatus TaxID=90255 RepID=UPI002220777D|nr:Alpha/Beta hydrolase protein [Cokeromyces recurvatus]XP_051380147.1 Alpha/Beta hydrolase protein [Cokeromyces recurvatus]KAI7899122.1 Alpha/Beta hydrolase protein [Cokeromyces recurvatus]KAI7900162.1 Alpha/Beta hydrolase protein [Cokeromyces recurvatus]
MRDHLVGKPSSNFKRIQILLTFTFGWCLVFYGKTNKLPLFIQKLNKKQARKSPWRVALASWLLVYFSQNIFLLIGLNAPDPLSRLYKRSFYRATWILTALDAGFFTAMSFKPLWVRHILSIVFSIYYLICADAAEEKVRKTRSTISVEQMRISWEKVAHNPILNFISRITRPSLSVKDIMTVSRVIDQQGHHLPPIEVHRYYAAPKETLKDHDTILVQFPGGGFVSMPPPCHEDALSIWANHTGLPVFSVNYKKAPEYPYPWPIDECFDLYVAIVQSKGKVLGLSGKNNVRIILLGDSAGGNITAAVTLKIISHNQTSLRNTISISSTIPRLPIPLGLILIYPALDFEMSCWMSPLHLSHKEAWASSRLAMTSRMSFFNDRIITPDLMRAMAILYLGPHASPDFDNDYLLSPIKAPEELLAQFPKTFMMCGEKILYISHAFLQMMAVLPEAHEAARMIGDWVKELYQDDMPLVDMLHRRKRN